MSKEQEFWDMVYRAINCSMCTVCEPMSRPPQSCADALRRAHAQTQPDWFELLIKIGCPNDATGACPYICVYDYKTRRACWLAYLKGIGWEPVS